MIKRIFISYILPVRDESIYIERLIESIIAQEHGNIQFEIIVADGMSEDGTREKVDVIKKKCSQLIMIDNPDKIVSSGFNRALSISKGDFIVRIDGHARLGLNFLKNALNEFEFVKADCVGGTIKNISHTFIGKAISAAQRSKFGVGGVVFRGKVKKGRYVDTLAFGIYRRHVFEKIGGYDFELVRNQDDEFNYRMIQNDFKIWLHPSIKSFYYTRNTLRGLVKQYFQYGFYKIRVFQKRKGVASIRQIIPLLFVITSILSIHLKYFHHNNFPILFLGYSYSILSIIFATSEMIKSSKFRFYYLFLPICFLAMHLSYGIGSLFGLLYFIDKWGDAELRDKYFDKNNFSRI